MSIPVFVRDRFKEVSPGRNASLFGPPAIGKNVHNRSVDEGFLLTFNEALDPTRASNTGSDTVLTNSKHQQEDDHNSGRDSRRREQRRYQRRFNTVAI